MGIRTDAAILKSAVVPMKAVGPSYMVRDGEHYISMLYHYVPYMKDL